MGTLINGQKTLFASDMIPLLIPTAMYIFGKANILSVLLMWVVIVFTASFLFGLISINAGHHHPESAHEGDEVP